MSTMNTIVMSSTQNLPLNPSSSESEGTCLPRSPESPDSRSSGEFVKIGSSFSYTNIPWKLTFPGRDSDDSAPAEYPPEQPEADTLDDDGAGYGAEEVELQAALERELADTEAKIATAKTEAATTDGDAEMAGHDQPEVRAKDDEEGSEAGSEDLEADSSGSEDEDEEEEGEGEAEGGDNDEDMEMGDADGDEKQAANGQEKPIQQSGGSEVMVH